MVRRPLYRVAVALIGALALGSSTAAAQNGYTNTLNVIQAHTRRVPLLMIAPSGANNSAWPNCELFVLRDSQIKTAADLIDRTIGVSSLHDLGTLATRASIERGGGDPARVKFLELPQSTMLDALTAKRVDAIVPYEPFRTAAEASGQVHSLGGPYRAINDQMMYTTWVALGPWVEQNRAAVAKFAQVIRQANDYMNGHIKDLIPLMASVTKLTPDSIQQLHRVRDATSLDPTFIQPVIDTAAHFNEIPASFPAREIIASGM